MYPRPPRSTRTDTLFPDPALFRSEGFAVGHVDAVLIGPKIRVPRAVVHRDANAFEEQFRRGGCFADRPCACQCPFGRAIDLRLVEDDKAPSKEAGAAFLAIGIRRRGFVPLKSAERRVGKEGVSTCRSRRTRGL